MKFKFALSLAVWTLLFGLVAIASPASAQGEVQQTAAERCFDHHKFGENPVDVAKTADGDTVLAQVSWGYHDTIGCYLSLDDGALAILRAAPAPQSLPDARTTTSLRCFEHHKFGENPVDVAKTTDGQTVLARLSWGYHDTIGCYLVLDDTALATLRAASTESDTIGESNQTDMPDEPEGSQEDALGVRMALESDPVASTGQSFEVLIEFTQVVSGFSASDITVVNGSVTGFSGSDSEYRATVRASLPGSVVMWVGRKAAQNQLGESNEPSQPLVANVRQRSPLTLSITAGSHHSCAIKSDQTITCWGWNGDGQTNAPTGQYTDITAGLRHSCAIKTDQTITCWGSTLNGLADEPFGQYTDITAGNAHACAIKFDKTITCWGWNGDGEADAPAGQYTDIAAGFYHSCAIKFDKTITCWGWNGDGEADAPAGQYTDIAAGFDHSCAIKIDQTIACWGNMNLGQTDAPTGEYAAITAGGAHSCAIKIDQTIACWGWNGDGQTNAPTGQYTAITAGLRHSCAVKTDKTTICWGNSDHGQTNVPAGQYTVITTASAIGSDFVDTWDREAVLADFTAEFDRQEPNPGWTGDLARCIAGTTSQEYRDSIFQRMNWYRQMAGVLPMVEDPELSRTAQAKALIMAAEGRLSHWPNPDWACYTSIPLHNESISTISGLESIDLYMQDSGSNNEAVGHRRMITHANLDPFGTGDIPDRANTLHAQYSSGQGEVREQRGFVAWPSPGYIPYPVVWGRWSFSLANADFSNATVTVVDDNGPVKTEIIHNRDSALVWAMDGDTNSWTHNRPLDGDHCYAVTISGVQIDSETQAPYEYATCVIDDPR